MTYDNIALKAYQCRRCDDVDSNDYILSFGEKQHIKVTEITKEIMDSFNGERKLDEVIRYLNEKNIPFSREDVIKFVDTILIKKGLVVGLEENESNEGMKSLLWCRIPIIESNRLSKCFAISKFLFNRWCATILLIAIAICSVINVYRVLFDSSIGLSSINSLAIIIISYVSLLLHEMGHVSAAYRYNVTVGEIGVGMYLFSPVFYVDVTNVWRLGKKERMVVDAGGIYFQLLTIIPVSVLSFITNDGQYVMIGLSILLLSMTNFLPFLKLDGYWLLTDWLELDNLSQKAMGIVGGLIKNPRKTVKNISAKYLWASLLYVVSTLAILCLGIISVINICMSFESIKGQVLNIADCFNAGNIAEGLSICNDLIVFLIPLLFFFVMVFRILKSVIKVLGEIAKKIRFKR